MKLTDIANRVKHVVYVGVVCFFVLSIIPLVAILLDVGQFIDMDKNVTEEVWLIGGHPYYIATLRVLIVTYLPMVALLSYVIEPET